MSHVLEVQSSSSNHRTIYSFGSIDKQVIKNPYLEIMEALLSPLKTTVISDPDRTEPYLVAHDTEHTNTAARNFVLQSPEDALEALKSKPGSDLLVRVLRWLESSTHEIESFNIKIPSPKAAQIIFVLVAEIIPDYWNSLTGKITSVQLKQKRSLLRCLSNISGIGAITARLRFFLDLEDNPQRDGQSSSRSKSQGLEELLGVLESLLNGSGFVFSIWIDINSLFSNLSQRALSWKEFTTTLAGGRLLSLAAEACHVINETSSNASRGSWIGNGSQYCAWLGENIAYLLMNFGGKQVEDWKALALLVNRALKLGYTGRSISRLHMCVLIGVRIKMSLWRP